MADQFYIESGYIDDKYYGYLADGIVASESLFTPSLTVAVTKNAFAVLDCVSTVSVVANTTKEVSAAIASSATVSSQGKLTKSTEVSLTASFSIAAEGEVTFGQVVEASGSWSSSVTVTLQSTKVLQLESSVTATYAQTTNANILKGFSSAITGQASQTVTAGRIQQGAVALNSQFAVAATISHIEGADLFAFSEATIAIEVSRIRDNNVDASVAFDIAVDYIRNRLATAEEFAEAMVSVDNLRVRYEEAALDAAFSMSATSTVIPAPREASADLNATASLDLTAVRLKSLDAGLATSADLTSALSLIKEYSAQLAAEASVTATISHIEGADLFAFADSQLAADVEVIRNLQANLLVDSTCKSVIGKIVTIRVDLTEEAGQPGGYFVVAVDADAIKDAEVTLFAEVQQTTASDRTRDLSADFALEFAQDLTYKVTKDYIAQLDIFVEQTSQVGIVKSAEISAGALFQPGVVAEATLAGVALLEADFQSDISADRTRDFNSALDSQSQLAVEPAKTVPFYAELVASADFSASSDRTRSTDVSVDSTSTLDAQVGTIKSAEVNAGSLFEPSISIDITKNAFAILDAVASLEITAIKEVFATSDLTVTGSLSINPVYRKGTSINVAVVSSASLTTLIRVTRAPVLLTGGNAIITTAKSKFGNGSLTSSLTPTRPGDGGTSVMAQMTTPPINFTTTDNWTIDFWRQNTINPPAGESQYILTIYYGGGPGSNSHTFYHTNTGFAFDVTGGYSGPYTQLTSTTSVPVGVWNHYRISKQRVSSTDYYTVWLNGTRVINGTAVTGTSTGGFLRLYGKNNVFFDEFTAFDSTITPYTTTSFSVPTAPWVNSSSNLWLYHLDSNLLDDNLAPSKVRSGSAGLEVISNLNSEVIKSVFAVSDQAVSTALESSAILTAQGSSDIQCQSTLYALGERQPRDGQADLISNFDLSTIISKIGTSAEANLTAESTLAIEYTIVQEASADIAATTEQTTDVVKTVDLVIAVESNTTVSIDANKISNTSAGLSAQGFVLAAVGKISQGTVIGPVDTTLSALIKRTRGYRANIQATATLTASALDLDLAQANITATTALTARLTAKYLGGRAAVNSQFAATTNANSNLSVYRSFYDPTLRNYTRYDGNYQTYDTGFTIGTGDFTVSLWFKNTILGPWNPYPDIPSFDLIQTSGLSVRIADIYSVVPGYTGTSTSTGYVQLYINNAWTTIFTFNWDDYAVAPWYNIKLVRKNGKLWVHYTIASGTTSWTYKLYTHATLRNVDFTNNLDSSTWIVNDNSDGNSDGSFDGQMDEFYVIKDYALYPYTFAPTGGDKQPIDYPVLDNNDYPIKIASTDFRTAGSLSAGALKVLFGVADLNAAFGQTNSLIRIRNNSSNPTVQASLTASGRGIANGASHMSAQFSATINPVATKRAISTQTVTATLVANNVRTRDLSSLQSSNFTQTTTVDKFKGAFYDIRDEFSLDLTPSVNRNIGVIQTDSIFTELAAVAKIGDFLVASDVVATMTVDGVISAGAIANITADTNLTAGSRVFWVGRSNQYVSAVMYPTVTKAMFGESVMPCVFQETVNGTKVIFGRMTTVAEFTLTAEATRTRDNPTQITASTTQITEAMRLRYGDANVFAQTEMYTSSQYIIRASADLTAFNTTLTTGRVIHLDEYLTYRVPAESRFLRIKPENRVYTIPEETRILKVKGYKL